MEADQLILTYGALFSSVQNFGGSSYLQTDTRQSLIRWPQKHSRFKSLLLEYKLFHKHSDINTKEVTTQTFIYKCIQQRALRLRTSVFCLEPYCLLLHVYWEQFCFPKQCLSHQPLIPPGIDCFIQLTPLFSSKLISLDVKVVMLGVVGPIMMIAHDTHAFCRVFLDRIRL